MYLNISINEVPAGSVDLRPDGFELKSKHPRKAELKALLEAAYLEGLELSNGHEPAVRVKSDDKRFFLELGIRCLFKGFRLGGTA